VQTYPDVAFGGGNYMVVWSDSRATYYRVYAARITPQGSVLDPNGFLVGPSTNTYQYYPAIAFNGTQFFVVWRYSTPYAITGRFIDTDGSVGDTVRVVTASGYVYCPSIAYDGNNFLIVYVERVGTVYTLKGQFVSGTGSIVGSPFDIASPVYYYYSNSVRFDGTNYIVTFSTNAGGQYQIWGRKYDTAGNPLSAAFQISNSSNISYYGDVFPGDNNRYLNIWCEYRGTQYDIYANVDIEIIGVEEGNRGVEKEDSDIATFIYGSLQLPKGKRVRIFDIAGRTVDADRLAPGVYFIEIEGKIKQKVIKLR
jgi:hypothetical protein